MSDVQILGYPFYKVIFKRPLYELVQEVRRKEFVNIRTWKSTCKRLVDNMSKWHKVHDRG
jgi:hypothetical protein